jgi:hypothetical protein
LGGDFGGGHDRGRVKSDALDVGTKHESSALMKEPTQECMQCGRRRRRWQWLLPSGRFHVGPTARGAGTHVVHTAMHRFPKFGDPVGGVVRVASAPTHRFS